MSELLEVAERVVAQARPGEQLEAYVSRSRDTEIVAFSGDIESLSSADSEGIGIRVIVDHREGFAYAGSLDEESIADALADARDNASFGTPDEFLGVAEPDGVAAVPFDPWSDEVATFPTERKVELAIELEKRVRAGDPRIKQVEAAEYGDGLLQAAIANTAGIAVDYRRTGCHLVVQAIAAEGDDNHGGVGYSVGRGPSELVLEPAADDAIRRATGLLGATKPPSAKGVTVVLDQRVTQSLLGILSSTLNGEAVLKKRSLFADRVGEDVAVSGFTLVDDPTNPVAYGAAQYDSEGLACRRNVLIDNGVLQGFLYNTYAARRAGVKSTASAARGFKGTPGISVRALAVDPGAPSQDEILRQVGTGYVIESVQGLHSGVNPISGDFSVGATGWLVEDGQRGAPIREFTIASTIQRMLKSIVAIGNDLEWLPGAVAGITIAIGDMSLSGS